MWLKFCRKNSSCGAALRHDALRRLPASRPERRGDHPPHRPLVGVPVPRPPRGDTAPVRVFPFCHAKAAPVGRWMRTLPSHSNCSISTGMRAISKFLPPESEFRWDCSQVLIGLSRPHRVAMAEVGRQPAVQWAPSNRNLDPEPGGHFQQSPYRVAWLSPRLRVSGRTAMEFA
jgi:hypothetical protein